MPLPLRLGKSAAGTNWDVNGDGTVNASDRTLASKSLNRRLTNGLHLD